jgi:hypothetical protein
MQWLHVIQKTYEQTPNIPHFIGSLLVLRGVNSSIKNVIDSSKFAYHLMIMLNPPLTPEDLSSLGKFIQVESTYWDESAVNYVNLVVFNLFSTERAVVSLLETSPRIFFNSTEGFVEAARFGSIPILERFSGQQLPFSRALVVASDPQVARYLLDRGADIHYNLEEPLRAAENLDLIRLYLDRGADFRHRGVTIRIVAKENNEIIRLFVERGASPSVLLDTAVQFGYDLSVGYLLQLTKATSGNLASSIQRNYILVFDQILRSGHVKPEHEHLILATRNDRWGMVFRLIDEGVPVSRYPLEKAMQERLTNVVERLIETGKFPEKRRKVGVRFATDDYHLLPAAARGDLTPIKDYVYAGGKISVAVLAQAVMNERENVVRFLLNHQVFHPDVIRNLIGETKSGRIREVLEHFVQNNRYRVRNEEEPGFKRRR